MQRLVPRRREPLTREQQELVRSATHIVEKIARKMRSRVTSLDLDDLRSLGEEGLVQAAQTYDPSFGVNFEGFAWPRVHGAMKNGVERERAQIRTRLAAAFAASYGYAEGQDDEGDAMHDTEVEVHQRFDRCCDGFVAALAMGYFSASGGVAGEEAMADQQLYTRAMAALRDAISSLPERDRELIGMHYEQKMELKQIAERLGVSYISARRYHHAAMQRLGGRVRARGVAEAP